MDTQLFKRASVAAATLILAGAHFGCTKSPEPAKAETAAAKVEAPKALDPITGHAALNQMYRPIREWAPDALPLTLTSDVVPGIANENGKAGEWLGVFVSPARREARTAFWAAADHADRTRGISVGGAQGWSGATTKSRPFLPTEFFVDSDEAYKTATAKAGEWVNKNPDKKLQMFLAAGSKNPQPVWVFMWGNTKSGYLAYINAASGKVQADR